MDPGVVSKESIRRAAKARLGEELAPGNTIRVGCLNAQGGMTSDIGEYEEFANKRGYDVLAIQESRLDPVFKLTAKAY